MEPLSLIAWYWTKPVCIPGDWCIIPGIPHILLPLHNITKHQLYSTESHIIILYKDVDCFKTSRPYSSP